MRSGGFVAKSSRRAPLRPHDDVCAGVDFGLATQPTPLETLPLTPCQLSTRRTSVLAVQIWGCIFWPLSLPARRMDVPPEQQMLSPHCEKESEIRLGPVLGPVSTVWIWPPSVAQKCPAGGGAYLDHTSKQIPQGTDPQTGPKTGFRNYY